MDADTIMKLLLLALQIGEQIAQEAGIVNQNLTTLQTIVSENRDPTAEEWAALDASEQTAYEAVQAG